LLPLPLQSAYLDELSTINVTHKMTVEARVHPVGPFTFEPIDMIFPLRVFGVPTDTDYLTGFATSVAKLIYPVIGYLIPDRECRCGVLAGKLDGLLGQASASSRAKKIASRKQERFSRQGIAIQTCHNF
jgi:hypothetical protein